METVHVLYCIWHYGRGLQRTLRKASFCCYVISPIQQYSLKYQICPSRLEHETNEEDDVLQNKGFKIVYHTHGGDF